MTHIVEISAGFSAMSGLIGLALLVFAARAYLRTRESAFAFLMGAFMVFALKAFLVAFALWTDSIGHETLELLDAIGDLATVGLLMAPFLFAERKE